MTMHIAPTVRATRVTATRDLTQFHLSIGRRVLPLLRSIKTSPPSDSVFAHFSLSDSVVLRRKEQFSSHAPTNDLLPGISGTSSDTTPHCLLLVWKCCNLNTANSQLNGPYFRTALVCQYWITELTIVQVWLPPRKRTFSIIRVHFALHVPQLTVSMPV